MQSPPLTPGSPQDRVAGSGRLSGAFSHIEHGGPRSPQASMASSSQASPSLVVSAPMSPYLSVPPEEYSQSLLRMLSWDHFQVAYWMEENGFGKYSVAFSENCVTGHRLLSLSYDSLWCMGITDAEDLSAFYKLLQSIKGAAGSGSSSPNLQNGTMYQHIYPPASETSSHPTSSAPPLPPFNHADSLRQQFAPSSPSPTFTSHSPLSGRISPWMQDRGYVPAVGSGSTSMPSPSVYNYLPPPPPPPKRQDSANYEARISMPSRDISRGISFSSVENVPSETVAVSNVSAVLMQPPKLTIPPRTKSREAFPTGWDAKVQGRDPATLSQTLAHGHLPPFKSMSNKSVSSRYQYQNGSGFSSFQNHSPFTSPLATSPTSLPIFQQSPSSLPERIDSLNDEMCDSNSAAPVDALDSTPPRERVDHRVPAVPQSTMAYEQAQVRSFKPEIIYPMSSDTVGQTQMSVGLKRQPPIREHQIKNSVIRPHTGGLFHLQTPEVEVSDRSEEHHTSPSNRKRPNLAIHTDISNIHSQLNPPAHRYDSMPSASPTSPWDASVKSHYSRDGTRELQSAVSSTITSPSAHSPSSIPVLDSPNSPFVRSVRDPSFYQKDSTMETAGLKERCIRVTGIADESHVIDVANLQSGQDIRNRIFQKFNIRDTSEGNLYGLYALDFSGQLDAQNPLDEASLLIICRSPNTQLRAHLVLKKINELLPPPVLETTESAVSPQTAPPPSRSSLSQQSPQLSNDDAIPILKRPSSRKVLKKLFSTSLRKASQRDVDESGQNLQPEHLPPWTAPATTLPSNEIPLLGPPDQDGFPIDGIDIAIDEPFTEPVPRRLSTKLEHFFGERPPSELICDNIKDFFPTLKLIGVAHTNSPPSLTSDEDEYEDVDHQEESLKRFVKETLKKKQTARLKTRQQTSTRPLETPATAFGSNIASENTDDPTTRSGHGASSLDRVQESERIGQEWSDRIASIDEEASVVSGQYPDWVPVSRNLPEPDQLDMAGGSDGEADPLQRPMASRRRSTKRILELDGVTHPNFPAKTHSFLPQMSTFRVDRVWTKSAANVNQAPRRRTVSNVLEKIHHGSPAYRDIDQSVPYMTSVSQIRQQMSRSDTNMSNEARRRVAIRLSRSEEQMDALQYGASVSPAPSNGKLVRKKTSKITVGRGGRRPQSILYRNSIIRLADANDDQSSSDISTTTLDNRTASVKQSSSRRGTKAYSQIQLAATDIIAEEPAIETSSEMEGRESLSVNSAMVSDRSSLNSSLMLSTADYDEQSTPGDPDTHSLTSSKGGIGSNFTLPRAFTNEPDKRRKVTWACGPLIGRGAYGKVFYGVNASTGEIMAVKQVELGPPRKQPQRVNAQSNEGHPQDKTKDARRRMMDALHREITLLKDLNHENIVRYLGYDVEGTMINVFLEYVSGGSIASSINNMGRFEEPLVRSLTSQILRGLAYLHERSIIHRDIKGGNVLLDENGIAKISDFGISKKNEYKFAYRLNSRMSMQGSVHWMAPEVIKAKGYSAKVDIWSLGCLILEMFTGYNPWRQLDELQTMWRLGRENTPEVPDWVSPDAEDFLRLCFIIDPDKRPTAVELLSHPFADVNPATIVDFRAYKEAAIEQKRLEDEEDYEDDDSLFGDEEGWLAGGLSGADSRKSLYIARVQSARRTTTTRRRVSNSTTSSRKNTSGLESAGSTLHRVSSKPSERNEAVQQFDSAADT